MSVVSGNNGLYMIGGSASHDRTVYNYVPNGSSGYIDIVDGVLTNSGPYSTPYANISAKCTSATKTIEVNVRFRTNAITNSAAICLFGSQTAGVYYRFISSEIFYKDGNEFSGIWNGITSNGSSWDTNVTISKASLGNPFLYNFNTFNVLLDFETGKASYSMNGNLIQTVTINNPSGVLAKMSDRWGFGSVACNNTTYAGSRCAFDLMNTWVKVDGQYAFQFFQPA